MGALALACLPIVGCGGGESEPVVLGAPPPPEAPPEAPPPVEPDTGLFATGPVGGPFLLTGRPIQVENATNGDIAYSVATNESWLRVKAPSSGEVAAGESVTVGLRIASGAVPAKSGRYEAAATVTNAANQVLASTSVTLVVSNGWTTPVASEDTRKIYVSNSEGSDANDGLSEGSPKATIAAGYALLRDGFPDWLLLKRGDVWTGEKINRWRISGRSPTEAVVFWAYGAGSERPLLLCDDVPVHVALGTSVRHIRFMGLHLKALIDSVIGFSATGALEDVLFEDLLIEGFGTNLTMRPAPSQHPDGNRDISVRRCVIADAASGLTHSQGLFIYNTDNLLVEECVFDHNGWRDTLGSFGPTKYNHNIYITTNCGPVTMLNNIIVRGSSIGAHFRSGGTMAGNLFLDNVIGFNFGYTANEGSPVVSGTVRGNVVSGGRADGPTPPRSGTIVNANGVDIEFNIFAHCNITAARALSIAGNTLGPVESVSLTDNIFYDWTRPVWFAGEVNRDISFVDNDVQDYDAGNVWYATEAATSSGAFSCNGNRFYSSHVKGAGFRVGGPTYSLSEWQPEAGDETSTVTQVTYPNPNATIADYLDSGSLDAFMAEARKQSRLDWREDYTAQAAVAWFQENFGMVVPTESD